MTEARNRAPRSSRRFESPLDWLAARKTPGGAPYLSVQARAAGDRLRADWERGLRAAPATMDWTRGPSDNAHGPRDGLSMAEAAVAARARVRRALDALGPDLARALVAVACEGRGREDVEAQEGWPRRSAKIVVRLGLDALARHYGLTRTGEGRAGAWLEEGARPEI